MKKDFNFVTTHLSEGEQILWQGTPGTGNLFTRVDAFMIPFSILWCAISFFVLILSADSSWKLLLFISFFVLIGLYMLIGRFIIIAALRRRTQYVITNRKIIRKRGSRVEHLSVSNMPPIHTELFKNGCGTIWFRNYRAIPSGSTLQRFRSRFFYDQNEYLFILENIPEAAKVHRILCALKG